ncbi:Pentapeptide repeat-containing protein [Lentzea albidocapillata subsp. violacea]|uniref:Pentapeptide repeat-containing protein n=1 Tax=Lentzea albidocapillata subsp. violacea TaxID=128104 RepID=A0A1G9DLK1_9PSEU|nr:pentapeptide repeat-containing protein [Lentzea albidocapillata]SDK64635.1 Pentapeptide repeat-containing protein [Lentzea albidocapillata subsp. violacea]
MPTNCRPSTARRLGLRAPTSRRRKPRNWQTVTSVVTAVTAAGALVFTGLSLEATRDQVTVALKQHELTEQGQVTDRYTKAVEQLGKAGAENLQSRLGAVYALERLGRDSPRDQPTVLEVLSAFVRTTAPTTQDGSGPDRGRCPSTSTTADVQAAVTVMGRRDPRDDRDLRIDLSGVCLVGVNLTEANLEEADLRGSVLSRAVLIRANFSRARLDGADLSGIRADNARFTSAVMSRVALNSALLEKTDFEDAQLWFSNLSDSYLGRANLSEATLQGADLRGTRLHDTTHDRTYVQDVLINERTEGVWW